MTPEDLEALAKIQSTFPILERHGQTYREHCIPTPSSPLALDDAEWLSLPLSQHVWGALAAVYDHFDIVRLTIEAQRLFPTGVYSLLRGALLGGCQALWLVWPDEPAERQERARRFTVEWYLRRIQFQTELTPDLAVDDAARSAVQLNRFDQDLAEIRRRRTSKDRFVATTVVAEAAAAASSEHNLQREIVSAWRRMGGDAHVLGWAMMTQNTEWGTKDADGLTGAVVTVSPMSLANSYLGAWLIYVKARRRLYELANLPDPATLDQEGVDPESGSFSGVSPESQGPGQKSNRP